MTAKTTFKCLNCSELNHAEPRSQGRQHYCSKLECRKASKAASQRRWRERPENRDYFRGAHHCDRVRRWRMAHPGYWRRRKPCAGDALQDRSQPQTVDKQSLAGNRAKDALQDLCQDLCPAQPALFVGLISVLTGTALQDDIAATARSFVSRGEEILRVARGSPLTNHPPLSP